MYEAQSKRPLCLVTVLWSMFRLQAPALESTVYIYEYKIWKNGLSTVKQNTIYDDAVVQDNVMLYYFSYAWIEQTVFSKTASGSILSITLN